MSEKLKKVIELLLTEKTEVNGKTIERKRTNFTGQVARLNVSIDEEILDKLLDGTAALKNDVIVEVQQKVENDKNVAEEKVLKKLMGNVWISPAQVK